MHVSSFGAKAEWTEEQLKSTVRGTANDACWSEQERCVISIADELHSTSTVHEQTWQRSSSLFSSEQLIELVMLAGSYHAVSFMVNAFSVQRSAFSVKASHQGFLIWPDSGFTPLSSPVGFMELHHPTVYTKGVAGVA